MSKVNQMKYPLRLDHIYFCTAPGAPGIFETLQQYGYVCTSPKAHEGVGTKNQCVILRNAYIEALWEADPKKPRSPIAQDIGLWDRMDWKKTGKCPFGIALGPLDHSQKGTLPFPFIKYHPPYMPEGMNILRAINDSSIGEPSIIYYPLGSVPEETPRFQEYLQGANQYTFLESVEIRSTVPVSKLSLAMRYVMDAGFLLYQQDDEYLMTLKLRGVSKPFEVDLSEQYPVKIVGYTTCS